MKKIKLFAFLILISVIPIFKVSASSANISVTSNKSRVIVGDNVTITVTVSSSDNLGSWSFEVAHSSNLSLVSGDEYIVDVFNNGTKKKSYTLVYKVKSKGDNGTATVSIKNSLVGSLDTGDSISSVNGKTTFNVITQSELEATYSKNNYLKSLSVSDYEINPKFDKETLEYSVELPNGTESIVVNATKEDNMATIKGTGTYSLDEGTKLIEIVVTSQSGSTRTYKLNATVKELDPIEVKIGNDSYTVVRKAELLPKANMYYQDTTIKINDFDVPAYYNESTKITLVGLKDLAGDIKLYVYENGKFSLYEELSFNQISLKIVDIVDSVIPEGYTKVKLDINGKTVLALKKENSEYYLIYGMNLENGKTNLYKYDKIENTVQIFENVEKIDNSLYYYIIAGLFGFIILSYIIFIALIAKNNKKAKTLENTMKIDITKIQKAEEKIQNELDNLNKEEKEFVEDIKPKKKKK